MAKPPAKTKPKADPASVAVNTDHLRQVVNAGAGGMFMPSAFAEPLRDAGMIEVGVSGPDGNLAVRATQMGVEYVGGAEPEAAAEPAAAPAPAPSKYQVFENLEIPAEVASNSPIRPSGYPFETMSVKAGFFVPDSEFKSGDAYKSIASTMATQRRALWPKRFVRRKMDGASFGQPGVMGAAVFRVEDGQGVFVPSTRGRKPNTGTQPAAAPATAPVPVAPAAWGST